MDIIEEHSMQKMPLEEWVEYVLQQELTGHGAGEDLLPLLDMSAGAQICIHTQGEDWNRSIDERGARLIQELQSALNRMVAGLSQNRLTAAARIKVQTEEGSNILNVDLTQVLLTAMNNLTPDQIVTLIKFTICGMFGLSGLKAVLAHITRRDQIKTDKQAANIELEKERMHLAHAEKVQAEMREFFGAVNFANAPMRHYAASLSAEDRLGVGGVPPMPVKSVRRAFRTQRQHSGEVTLCCDGQYHITGMKFRQEPPSLTLESGTVKADASLIAMDGAARAMLMNYMTQALEERRLPLRIQVQVDAVCSKTRLCGVKIVGIGPARQEDLYLLGELPGAAASLFESELDLEFVEEEE